MSSHASVEAAAWEIDTGGKEQHTLNHKVSVGVTISIAAIVCALTFVVTSFFSLQSFNEKVQAVKEKAEKYDRLEALDTYVRDHYYTEELDEDALMNGILKGYVAGLDDPYSQYLTAEEYDARMTKESGQQIGIGVTVTQDEDGMILVISVEENSPAAEAGIQADDQIIAVNTTSVEEVGYDTAVNSIKGEEGTSVMLTILRNGSEHKMRITRRSFDVRTVYSQMLDGQIGYIRITAFRDNTVEQFKEALDGLTANGARGLIYDVRDNGGGLLSALEQMLDPLLPEGEIATATYQGGETETVVYSDAVELNLPMAILVNGGSASAAELFSASLRDFGKAKLVGTQTYGKGVMQVTRRMEDGGGLTLTVATYQTVLSECYQGVGLAPDIEVEALEETDISAMDPETDPQLAAALSLLRD